jgi:hypothetical protein
VSSWVAVHPGSTGCRPERCGRFFAPSDNRPNVAAPCRCR